MNSKRMRLISSMAKQTHETGLEVPKDGTIYREGKRFSLVGFSNSRKNGCLGKQVFKNLSAAENHILKHFPEDFDLLPYKCSHCNRFHVGHEHKYVQHQVMREKMA